MFWQHHNTLANNLHEEFLKYVDMLRSMTLWQISTNIQILKNVMTAGMYTLHMCHLAKLSRFTLGFMFHLLQLTVASCLVERATGGL